MSQSMCGLFAYQLIRNFIHFSNQTLRKIHFYNPS